MQIGFVAYDGLTALDLIGPLEVLSRVPGTDVEVVASQPGTLTSDNGALQLVASRHLAEMSDPDVIVVPGGVGGTWQAMQDAPLLSWLRSAAVGARWVTSVCTGAHVLGAAGLLAGRRATTHWAVLRELEAHGAIPTAQRVVIDGNVATAAGVSAGIDLTLWLAGELAGADVARTIQLLLEYDPQPPFDAGSPDKAGPELQEVCRRLLFGATGAAANSRSTSRTSAR
jgi:transcriptional regulator GlxA family with amidase domain